MSSTQSGGVLKFSGATAGGVVANVSGNAVVNIVTGGHAGPVGASAHVSGPPSSGLEPGDESNPGGDGLDVAEEDSRGGRPARAGAGAPGGLGGGASGD